MPKTIASEWQDFRDHVIPAGAPARQVTDLRRGFYAGAFAVLTCLTTNLSNEEHDTPEDLQVGAPTYG